MNSKKKVAVIGAGVSGLVSIKACKEEKFEVVCYEITDDIGGLWKYRDENIPGVASVSKKTVMNTNKEMSAFSDFPPPIDFPTFMPHQFVHKYLCLYAEKYSLIPHVRFGRKVTLVKEAEDFENTGRWVVTATVLRTMKTEVDVYDAVMVCTGSYSNPIIPHIPGQEDFKGNIYHSWNYKESSKFKGRKVLIVGMGNSAADVAVDLCNVAESIYMSTRNATWLFSRAGHRGQPFDSSLITRLNLLLFQYLPLFVSNKLNENDRKNWFDISLYLFPPKKRFLSTIGTVNDFLPFHILSGGLKLRGTIKQLTSEGVLFEKEVGITPVDDVIFGTGYKVTFPFLEKNLHSSDMYRSIISPDLKHSTLAFIGLVEATRHKPPLFEMQALWFMQLLKGNIKLPPKEEMRKQIADYKKAKLARFGEERPTIVLESYMEELTADFGAKPNLFSILFRDPILFLHCLTGPLLPYQYRLGGPHPWSGAREAILNYRKRIYVIP